MMNWENELFFVPAVVLPGMISKRGKDLTPDEVKVAIPVNGVYKHAIKFVGAE